MDADDHQVLLLDHQVLNYCMLSKAAYDAYDSHTGTCRYGHADLLPALGLGDDGYVVTWLLYATVNNGCPHRQHWIGYIAVATNAERDRVGYRDIVVVWRGTSALNELWQDLQAHLVPIPGEQNHPGVEVETGFQTLYRSSCDACGMPASAGTQVLGELTRLVTYLTGDKICVTATGHSLGGALALLTAWDAADPAAAAALRGVVVRAVTFGAPRVGNQAFCDELVGGQRNVSVRRVIVNGDVVPTLPPTFFHYADAGNNLLVLHDEHLQHFPPPFLTSLFPWHFHSIKQYLHCLLLHLQQVPPVQAAPAPAPADHLLPVLEPELDNGI